jgi:DNA-binding transcriptional ArsR family regulator
MTTRKISNTVWYKIVASGLVTGMRLEVLRYVYEKGPCTISQALRDIPHKRDSTVNARFSELRRMKLIEEVRTVKDPCGTHEVALWDLTGDLPKELPKPRKFHVLKAPGRIGLAYTKLGQARQEYRLQKPDSPATELIEVVEKLKK